MYSKERQQEHISQIRRILVVKPEASILDIKDSLSKQRSPLDLDKDYINKLVNRIRKERAKRLDKYTINVILANFQDEVEELKKRLWLIITNPNSSDQSKISAIRELRTSSKDLFDKMFDAGAFKRKLGEVQIGKSLSKEEQDLIKQAIELNYGTEEDPNSTATYSKGDGSGDTSGEDKKQ